MAVRGVLFENNDRTIAALTGRKDPVKEGAAWASFGDIRPVTSVPSGARVARGSTLGGVGDAPIAHIAHIHGSALFR